MGTRTPVIGLEIHVQLRTRTKLFCGCRVEFGAAPNTHVCPVCLGLPGALPVLNARAVDLAVTAALALDCRVHDTSIFARKNYFYPDLPKGYQITQYDRPLASGGHLAPVDGPSLDAPEPVRIRRLHLEEDAGKSLHDRFDGRTAIDLNRAGTPLIEIVTEPDLHSPAHARSFLDGLKRALTYLDVSDCNMEEGSLRVDANISVRRHGQEEASTKTEIKNMNSFSQLEKALEFEVRRHTRILDSGEAVRHQTMLWDAAAGLARPMRRKEEAHDYRYFPEPDLGPLRVREETTRRLRSELPELPAARMRRLMDELELPAYDAGVLTSSRALADYFESLAAVVSDPKTASNWVMGEVLAVCRERGVSPEGLGVEAEALGELIGLVEDGTLSNNLGKEVLRKMAATGERASRIVEREGLRQIGDRERIRSWARDVLDGNPEEVARYRDGEAKLLGFFIGQVMRKSSGKADPEVVRSELLDLIGR